MKYYPKCVKFALKTLKILQLLGDFPGPRWGHFRPPVRLWFCPIPNLLPPPLCKTICSCLRVPDVTIVISCCSMVRLKHARNWSLNVCRLMVFHARDLQRTACIRGRKLKVHTLDIAPLRSESPPQKRSGMARVLKGFHSFTYTHSHVHLQSE